MQRPILLSKPPMAACIAATPSRPPASEPRDTGSLPVSVVVWNHEDRIRITRLKPTRQTELFE